MCVCVCVCSKGTGKTTTLIHLARQHPEKKFLYLVYNKSVKENAAKLFPSNVTCLTIHALIFRRTGWAIGHKISTCTCASTVENERSFTIHVYNVIVTCIYKCKCFLVSILFVCILIYSKIYKDHDKIGDVRLLDLPSLQLDVDLSESTNKDDMMSPFKMNKFCYRALLNFFCSADQTISLHHLPNVDVCTIPSVIKHNFTALVSWGSLHKLPMGAALVAYDVSLCMMHVHVCKIKYPWLFVMWYEK